MKGDQIEETREQFKEKWADLTDDDLIAIAGDEGQLAGKSLERYGYATDRRARELDEFAGGMKA